MKVFSPFNIGSLSLSNRLLMAPVKTAFGTLDGKSTYRHEAYYRRRAEGGVGAIIVEPCYVEPRGKEHPKQLGISDYIHLESLKRLVAAIHAGGAVAIAHLNHHRVFDHQGGIVGMPDGGPRAGTVHCQGTVGPGYLG